MVIPSHSKIRYLNSQCLSACLVLLNPNLSCMPLKPERKTTAKTKWSQTHALTSGFYLLPGNQIYPLKYIYTSIYLSGYILIYVYLCVYIYVSVCVCLCVRECVCAHACTRVDVTRWNSQMNSLLLVIIELIWTTCVTCQLIYFLGCSNKKIKNCYALQYWKSNKDFESLRHLLDS